MVWFHLPSLHELHRVVIELCKSQFSKFKSKLLEINPSFHCMKSLKVVAEANSIGVTSSGPPRQDTLRPGEGERPPESDGPLASRASAESSGGWRIG